MNQANKGTGLFSSAQKLRFAVSENGLKTLTKNK